MLGFSPIVQKFKHMFTNVSDTNGIIKPADVTITDEELLKKITDFKYSIYDCLKIIRDPEKPATLEDLNVVYEDGVKVGWNPRNLNFLIDVEFNPTVPHCSLATVIGLCMKVKLDRHFKHEKYKLAIHVKKGSHETEQEINKQINDKERVAAAMEITSIQEMVNKCIEEND